MIQNVIIHLGAAGDGVHTRVAWSEAKFVLAEQGICAPEPQMDFGLPLMDIHNRRTKNEDERIPHDTNFIIQFCAHLRDTTLQTDAKILYFDFWACFFWLPILPLLHSLMRNTFSQARIHAFLSLPRQDIALEARHAVAHLQGIAPAASWLAGQRKNQAYRYARCLKEIFSVFGRDNVSCFIPDSSMYSPENLRYATLSAQEAFWRAVGLHVPLNTATGLACFQPHLELYPPREFWCFCRICNEIAGQRYEPHASPWAQHSIRFADWPGTSLFSPQERAAFVTAHEEDNAESAALIGREQLFAPVDVDHAWEPFPGLTEESAFRIAERLDRDFAAARMAEFDATPVLYLSREQRLCRQALHDACDPPSAMPPLRAKWEDPKLSVLTPTYNQAAYIAECMESVIAQRTDFPVQHIIADDGSDDGAQDIILDYAARYPHIIPVFQKTRSYGARNIRTLFDMARSEYVALCDGDDYFSDPNKLQRQVDFLEAHTDAALCFHRVRIVYEDGSGREGLFPDETLLPGGVRPLYDVRDLFIRNIIQTNTVMYRWRFTKGLPDWFRANLLPGDWYWHLLHAELGKIGFIDQVMSVYRKHEKGMYYLSDVDRLKHRQAVGMKELEFYDVVNTHFKRQFESMILDLTDDVFADCLLYGAETGDNSVLEAMLKQYPPFARHFWESMKNARKGGS